MSLLFRVLTATACRSTHHKLALHALQQVRGARVRDWQSVFLNYHALYLQGAKAPDDEFKDFRNHVLHVRENDWGGAITASQEWYASALAAMRARNWATAVYHAGVLSHYYTDPLMPFHTGSSEAESVIHRAAEWSVTKTYDALVESLGVLGGFPALEAPAQADWLAAMVREGARASNVHYEALIRHYDFARGVAKPEEGFNPAGQAILARLLGHAIIGFARILERLFAEAGTTPPQFDLTLPTVLATLNVPANVVLKKMRDVRDRAQVEAIYKELQATGKVEKNLPEENRVVRAAYAREVVGKSGLSPAAEPTKVPAVPFPAPSAVPVLHKPATPIAKPVAKPLRPAPPVVGASDVTVPQPSRADDLGPALRVANVPESPAKAEPPAVVRRHQPLAAAHEPPRTKGLRFYLDGEDEIAAAPSIGPKTAARLEACGVRTVNDLLAADPAELAADLGGKKTTAQTILAWKHQATLALCIPELRGHDAQILVACGYRTPDAVAKANPAAVWAAVRQFAATSECQRLLRSSSPPDEAEVKFWVASAQQARAA